MINSELNSTNSGTGVAKRNLPSNTDQEWKDAIAELEDELLRQEAMDESRFEDYCKSVNKLMSRPPPNNSRYLPRVFPIGCPEFATISRESGFQDYLDYNLKSCMVYYDLFFDSTMD